MPTRRIRDILREKLGLDASTIGPGVVDHVVRDRMAACKVTDAMAYEALLRQGTELQELINAVVIPETWFFRDSEPFRLLQKHATGNWWPQNPAGKFRILSIPCSTGEEPYSIAMALSDSGLTALNYEIDAVDISTRALGIARHGVYAPWSFRSQELSFRDRYFSPLADGSKQYKLDSNIRRTVNFIQGNILDPLFFANQPPYDAVFCRNLLIYFDGQGREAAIRTLERLLKHDGLLFVGHAESLEAMSEVFEPIRHRFAFAYRKASRKAPTTSRREPVQTSRTVKTAPSAPIRPRVQVQPSRPGPENNSAKESALVEARRLADQGKLRDAAILCERRLVQTPADADAHCLMGIISEASGDRGKAEACYQRSLYLNSQHQEALWHLILLLESKGEHAQAEVLRQRIERLKARSSRVGG
jgi:chemotaxis protein methyltransferase WspC